MNIQKSVKIGIVIFNQQLQRSEIALQAQKVLVNKRSGKKSVNEKHKVVVYIWNIDWRLLEIDKRRCHFIQPLLICNILPFAIKCQQFFQVIPLTFIKCSNSCSVTIILYNPKWIIFQAFSKANPYRWFCKSRATLSISLSSVTSRGINLSSFNASFKIN